MRHTLKIQLFNERCSRPIHLFEADSCRTWHVACHDKLLPLPPGCVIVLQIFAPERHDGRGNIRPAVVCVCVSRNSHGGHPISEPFTGRVEF